MSEFVFKGNVKVTFIPFVQGETPTVRQMSGEDQACDCGCEDVEREPAADLTFYREEPKSAGVSPGFIVLRRGGEAAEVANMSMIHDGEGHWVGDIDHDSWRTVEVRDEP